MRPTVFIAFSLLGFYGVLVLSLVLFLDPSAVGRLLSSDRVLFSIRLSFIAAFLSTLLSVMLALPAAYALSRHEFRGKFLVDLLLELPLIISPVALGATLLIFFGTAAGQWLQNMGFDFVYTFQGIILAQVATSVGLATRTLKTAIDEIDPRYEAVARSLGASDFHVFRTVTLPLARRGIAAALVVAFAKSIGEFGATVTLAGTMPMRTETLPVSIYLRLANADVQGAALFILLLLIIGLVVAGLSRALLVVKQ